MNEKILGSVLLLLSTCGAFACDVESAREMFRRMDTNGDRALQFTEVQAARAALFDRLDSNRNGILDEEEVQVAVRRVREARGTPATSLEGFGFQASRMDTNSNGRISRDEFARFIPDRLLRADTNGDRSLSLPELRKLKRN